MAQGTTEDIPSAGLETIDQTLPYEPQTELKSCKFSALHAIADFIK